MKIKPIGQRRSTRAQEADRCEVVVETAHTVVVDIGLIAAVVILVSSPELFMDEPFMLDYANSLWLSWFQGHAIADGIVPSYFLHTSLSIFDPIYAFYGGRLGRSSERLRQSWAATR